VSKGKEKKMEEKKLTDEEIIKAYSNCADHNNCCECPLWEEMKRRNCICREIILGVINRLQSENESLKKDYIELDLEARELRTENDKQKAEIERLTEERDVAGYKNNSLIFDKSNLQTKNGKLQKEIERWKEEYSWLDCKCQALQKQVDELKEKLWKSKQDMMTYHSKTVAEAVKDTAKEIYHLIDMSPIPTRQGQQRYATGFENGLTSIKLKIAERYGVEVE
jgi:hypothetical protein